MKLRFFVLILSLVSLNCVYSFRGFSGKESYDVFVEVFKNTSEKAGIESEVTRWVIDELEKDVRINLVSLGKAKYVIHATISGYKTEPYEYRPDGTVLSYKVILMVYISILDLSTNQRIVEEKVLSAWGVYASSQNEDDGLKGASEDLGKKILQEFLSAALK